MRKILISMMVCMLIACTVSLQLKSRLRTLALNTLRQTLTPNITGEKQAQPTVNMEDHPYLTKEDVASAWGSFGNLDHNKDSAIGDLEL
jgi:hypothetical protein